MLADSMVTHTSITANGSVVTNFEHAEKLICLGKALPAAAMFNGQATLLDEFVTIILKQAGHEAEKNGASTAKDVVDTVKQHIDTVYRSKIPDLKKLYAAQWSEPETLAKVNNDRKNKGLAPANKVEPNRVALIGDPTNSTDPKDYDVVFEYSLTVVVAAWFGNDPTAVEIMWPGAKENDILKTFGKNLVFWGTGGIPVGRLLMGYDFSRLRDAALTDPQAQIAHQYFQKEQLSYSMPVPMSAMPLQDAINFAEFMGETAAGYDRFRAGPPTVGGELDILVLSADSREWVDHKEFHSKRRQVSRSGR